jgi:hypothetical protein
LPCMLLTLVLSFLFFFLFFFFLLSCFCCIYFLLLLFSGFISTHTSFTIVCFLKFVSFTFISIHVLICRSNHKIQT